MADPKKADEVHAAHEHLIARMQAALLSKATPDFVRGLAQRAVETDPRYKLLNSGDRFNSLLLVEYCLASAEQRVKDNVPVQYPGDM